MTIEKIVSFIKARIQVLEISYGYDKNDEYMNAKLLGGVRELKNILELIGNKE